MDRIELKKWAKEKIKNNVLQIFLVILIASILTNLSIPTRSGSIPIGWLLYFVNVGLTFYMVNFVNGQQGKIEDLFSFSKDFVKDLLVGFVSGLIVALWSLLLIVPGIIKAYAYALVPMLLTDDKYKDMDVMSLLRKSEEMMLGHKMDLFVLQLSFIGWHLLAPFTFFLLEIWIMPYQKTAETKFLYDIKAAYEANTSAAPVEEPTAAA